MPQDEQFHETFQNLSSLLSGTYNDAIGKADSSERHYPISEEIREIHDRYGSKSELTQGGMKKIEVVEDSITGHPIAKATLRHEATSENIEFFLREARITAGLEHPNIVPIYDIGFDDNQPFFTMKLLTGDSLQKVLKELSKANPLYIKRYDLNTRLNIFRKICDAVSYAHSKGVVHLDLKPDNIQLGEFGEVYICDWGLSKVITDDDKAIIFDSGIYNFGTIHGDIKGTPGFMAPEQISSKLGEKGIATDIYSLGALLFALLNFHQPISANSVKEVLNKTLNGELNSWNDSLKIPHSLKAVCHKALSINKSRRYKNVKELTSEITAYLNGFATNAEGAGFFSQLKLLILRNLKVSLTIFSATILVIALILGFMIKIKENEQSAISAKKNALTAQKNAEKALNLYKKQQQETRKAYTLYTSEKITAQGRLVQIQESEALQQQNLPTLLLLGNHNIFKGKYENAIKLLKTVLRNHPTNKKALQLIGTAHLYQHEFQQAADAFEKTDKKKFSKLVQICRKFARLKTDNKLNDELYLQLLNDLTEAPKLKEYTTRFINDLHLVDYRESYIPLLKKCLEILNPEQKSVTLTVTRKHGKNYVNLSGNIFLKHISPLERIYLYSLNLNNTAVKDLSALPNKRGLTYLDLSGTGFKNVIQIVRGFPGLKELTISTGQLTQSQINMLPRGLKIIYR